MKKKEFNKLLEDRVRAQFNLLDDLNLKEEGLTRSNRVFSSHDGHVSQSGQWDLEDRDLHPVTLNPEVPISNTTFNAISNTIYNLIFDTITDLIYNPNATLISDPINRQISNLILDEVNDFYTD